MCWSVFFIGVVRLRRLLFRDAIRITSKSHPNHLLHTFLSLIRFTTMVIPITNTTRTARGAVPWLTRNMLDHYILTYSTDGLRVPKMIIAQEQTIVSGLTNFASTVRAATTSAIATLTAMGANTACITTSSTN
jgi:hypothetical protein